jgi:hypothetical protein
LTPTKKTDACFLRSMPFGLLSERSEAAVIKDENRLRVGESEN